MQKYRVHTRDEGVLELEAARFERNGSGTTFYDDQNRQVEFFGDGEVKSVRRASTVAVDLPPDPAGPESVDDGAGQ